MKNTSIAYVQLFKRFDGSVHYAVWYKSGHKHDFYTNDNLPNSVVTFLFEISSKTETKTTVTGSVTKFS